MWCISLLKYNHYALVGLCHHLRPKNYCNNCGTCTCPGCHSPGTCIQFTFKRKTMALACIWPFFSLFFPASWTTEGKKLDQKQLIVLKIEWVPMFFFKKNSGCQCDCLSFGLTTFVCPPDWSLTMASFQDRKPTWSGRAGPGWANQAYPTHTLGRKKSNG